MARIDEIFKILKKEAVNWDVPVTDLVQIKTRDPFKVLITTILSARTKDSTTGPLVKELFKHVKNLNDLEKIKTEKLEKLIFKSGFYRTKAKNLKKLPKVIKERFNGRIPENISGLLELPGVGRKTANLVISVSFNKPGITVDTHCHRIPNRWGYVKTKNPYETEMELRRKLPKKYWRLFNRLLVPFGQNICKPVTPLCSKCPVSQYCERIGVVRSR